MNCSCRVLSPNVTTFGLAISLKRRVSQDFALYFFHDSYSSAPQINRLKCFFFNIFFIVSPRRLTLSGGMHTAEIVSVEWCTPWRLSLRSDAHSEDSLRRVVHTGKIVSAEWCTSWRLSPLSDAHCRDLLRGVMHTEEFLRNLNILSPIFIIL